MYLAISVTETVFGPWLKFALSGTDITSVSCQLSQLLISVVAWFERSFLTLNAEEKKKQY